MRSIQYLIYQTNLPFAFLKINNTMWNKSTMSCTCATTYTGAVQMIAMGATIVLRPVIMTSRFLAIDELNYKFLYHCCSPFVSPVLGQCAHDMVHVLPWITRRQIEKHHPPGVSSEDVLISYFHPPQFVAYVRVLIILVHLIRKKQNLLLYLSSAFHSVSGAVLIPICGQAGQNNARPPSAGRSGRSWTIPARIRLWRSRHCLDTRRSSRYRSYLVWAG